MKIASTNYINQFYALLVNILKRFSLWRYVLILGVANVASIIRLFVYAKIISVEEFGSYATLTLISGVFVIIGSLGLLTELQRRLPIYFRDKDFFKILTTVTQIVIVVLGVFLSTSIVSLFDIGLLGIRRGTLLIGIFGGVSQLLFSIITSETRSRQLMIRFSNEILLKNILSLVAGLALAFYFNNGVWIFLTESLVTIVMTVILFGRLSSEYKMYGYTKILNTAIFGFKQLNWFSILSMFAIGLLAFAMQNGERYFAKSVLSIHNFAILSFGLIIPNIATNIQTIFNSSIFINQVIRFNENGRGGVIRYSIKMTVIFASFSALVSLPGYFVTREAISTYYPKYVEIVPFLPLVFLAFIVRSSDFISNIYIIINKAHYIVIIQSVYILFLFMLFISISKNILDFNSPLYYIGLNLLNAVIPILIILITIRIKK